ncbi:MAG: thiamine phosphate synthase [Hyphococcus sp.]
MGQPLRSQLAAAAAAAKALQEASGAASPFRLAFLTDHARVPNPDRVIGMMPEGSAAILRDYRDPGRRRTARRLAALCKARGVVFLVGADAGLARAVGAAGVHLPSWITPKPDFAEAGLVTAACHGAADLARAGAAGVDLALLSPVFPTASHPQSPALGVMRFRALASASPVPVLALGGVTAANAAALKGRNVAGFAAIGALAGGGASGGA